VTSWFRDQLHQLPHQLPINAIAAPNFTAIVARYSARWGASKLPLPSQTFRFAFFIVASLIASVAASKAVTYSYVGDTFTTFGAQGVPPSNAEAAFAGKYISGEFTVAAPLGADFNGLVTPIQFAFSGALVPLTSPSSYSFDIQTNDAGAIIDWMISIQENIGPSSMSISTSNAGDSSSSLGPTTLIEGSNSAPGTWSVTSTPLPPTLLLFATGLGALGLFGWKRRRSAAA
jgi:hypothetical protein